MTVTGDEAQHSDLPQNKQIVKIIEEYLLDGRNPNNPANRNNAGKGDNGNKVSVQKIENRLYYV